MFLHMAASVSVHLLSGLIQMHHSKRIKKAKNSFHLFAFIQIHITVFHCKKEKREGEAVGNTEGVFKTDEWVNREEETRQMKLDFKNKLWLKEYEPLRGEMTL